MACPPGPAHVGGGSSADPHTPLSRVVCPRLRSDCPAPAISSSVSGGGATDRHVPRAPLPGTGVTRAGPVSRTGSGGVTHPSSLLRAHAPVQNPPTASGSPSVGGSLQVAASPCWEMDLPDVIPVDLSPDAWTHTPAAREVRSPVSSLTASAFPNLSTGRRPASTAQRLQSGNGFRGCSHSLMFRPPGLLATQVAPTAGLCVPGRPWLLRPGRTRVVASACTGYACCPNRAIDSAGTSTPQDRSLVGCSDRRPFFTFSARLREIPQILTAPAGESGRSAFHDDPTHGRFRPVQKERRLLRGR